MLNESAFINQQYETICNIVNHSSNNRIGNIIIPHVIFYYSNPLYIANEIKSRLNGRYKNKGLEFDIQKNRTGGMNVVIKKKYIEDIEKNDYRKADKYINTQIKKVRGIVKEKGINKPILLQKDPSIPLNKTNYIINKLNYYLNTDEDYSFKVREGFDNDFKVYVSEKENTDPFIFDIIRTISHRLEKELDKGNNNETLSISNDLSIVPNKDREKTLSLLQSHMSTLCKKHNVNIRVLSDIDKNVYIEIKPKEKDYSYYLEQTINHLIEDYAPKDISKEDKGSMKEDFLNLFKRK